MTDVPSASAFRLHHRRRRLGRLRPGQSADGFGPPPRAAAGSRRPRSQYLDSHSARLRQAVRQCQGQLALQHRARAGPQQPQNHPAARQGAGRIELDQRAFYIRGQHEDYDHWRQLGNTGWAFADVLPYFRRAEDQERGADDLHGAGGPLAVSDVSEPHPLCEAFIEAAQQAGFPRNDDFNGPTQEGAGYFQLTARNGRRWSTAVGYLRQARAAAQSRGGAERAGDARAVLRPARHRRRISPGSNNAHAPMPTAK